MSVVEFPKARAAPYLPPKRKLSLNWWALAAILVNFAIWAGLYGLAKWAF